jgi:hypothetical protein
MTDVIPVRSLVERLVTIAADCFDHRAAERLRALADELHNASRPDKTEREAASER